MTEAELLALNRHVETAQSWIAKNVPNRRGVIVALAGPAWVAFWLGRRLNRKAGFGRVDYHYYSTDPMRSIRYEPALSSPRHQLPWLSRPPRLLFLSAEPDCLTRTKAKSVAETIEGALAGELGDLEANGEYVVRARFGVTPESLREELDAFHPDVIHVHMHGSTRRVLGFEGEERSLREVPHDLFVRVLRRRRIEPVLVVMSACHSALMASALADVAECVVSMRGEVPVVTATRFAKYLYHALARGESLGDAVALAADDVELDGMKGYEVIDMTSTVEDELADVVLFRQGAGR